VSAISQIGDLYCQNSSDLNQYQNTLAAAQLATSRGLVCNADDRLRRAVIQQLICNFSLEFAEIEQAFNIDFQGYFGALWPQLQGMANDGLIKLDASASKCCRPDACWCARCAWCSTRTWNNRTASVSRG
jgi:oxygen-independent coproporphyrinogen-3 oxidase